VLRRAAPLAGRAAGLDRLAVAALPGPAAVPGLDRPAAIAALACPGAIAA